MSQNQELVKEVDDLNSMAWKCRVYDSKKTMQFTTQAAQLSREINYRKGLADALVLEAFYFIRISDFEKATSSLDETETIYKPTQNIRGLATLNEYRGIIERYQGNCAKSLEYIYKALEQSRQTSFSENEVTNLYQIGVTFRQLANYDKALDYLYESLALSRTISFVLMVGYNLNVIGSIYFETGDYNEALTHFKQSLLVRRQSGDKWGEAGSLDNIGFTCFKLGNYQEAIEYCENSLAITRESGDKKGEANTLAHLAEIYGKKKDLLSSLKFSNESLDIRKSSGDRRGEAEILLFLAELYSIETSVAEENNIYEWLTTALATSEEIKANDLVSKVRLRLYEYYKSHKNFMEAITQLEIHTQLEKDLHTNTVKQKILNIEISHSAEEIKKEAETVMLRNEELTRLNEEIRTQKEKLEKTLAELKATQAQLIQSEKMASLGELTAGIAHEIQNPLNFVNNFSEVNTEMLEELNAERLKPTAERNEQLENEILNDIKSNEEKINHHGKRAGDIVKGMLQHSRSSTGVKEPTNINALADEYLRLSYHGLRAKDKSFNATMKTDFDETIGQINIIPQDIGRVLLNLYNNAFYTCAERSRSTVKEQISKNLISSTNQEGFQNLLGFTYEPTVLVTTKKIENNIIITVIDNGNGIPQNIVDKIFQPFFTTKPTGQGTGLGLSLSYDIVKAHGGEIKVESKEGEGTEFIIHLSVV